VLAMLAVGAAIGAAGESTFALFSGGTSSSSSSLNADTDWAPPEASASVIVKVAGGEPGYVRPGGTYYFYADVRDSGNPASGIASVGADAGLGLVTLSAGGPWTVGGVSYDHRSVLQTVPTGAPAGTYPYTVTSTDLDLPPNSQTQGGFNVTVDATAPAGSNVQTANGAATVGRPEQGDSLTFTYSEPMEPISILTGWDGASTSVVVRIDNAGGGDRLQVWNAANAFQLPLTNAAGLNLGRTDYVTSNQTFGAGGTASTMVRSGNSITITLGTASGTTTTAAGSGTMSWTPSGTATDRAGNPASTTAVSEPGPADPEF
jgi:hypothetical protein